MSVDAIRIEDVWATRARREVLRGATLAVGHGETLALLGPSGAGKSSLLRVILGLLAPSRGRVLLDDEIVSDGSRIIRAPEERGLGMVFQDLALWPHLTVAGNLAFPLRGLAMEKRAQTRRIDALLERVGLIDERDCRPDALSGGERQRVAIARALVTKPRAVLLDEPLASLDVLLKRQLLGLFSSLFRENGTSVLYVTHDPREAAQVGSRIAIMSEGATVQTGTVDELRANPRNAFVEALLRELS
jgi:iron(III) transport system ATP-binding protein